MAGGSGGPGWFKEGGGPFLFFFRGGHHLGLAQFFIAVPGAEVFACGRKGFGGPPLFLKGLGDTFAFKNFFRILFYLYQKTKLRNPKLFVFGRQIFFFSKVLSFFQVFLGLFVELFFQKAGPFLGWSGGHRKGAFFSPFFFEFWGKRLFKKKG